MSSRDEYFISLIRDRSLTEDNVEEVYKEVCNHLEQVLNAKGILEIIIINKGRNSHAEELERLV